LLDSYRYMLPKDVICPRCDKPGFLTLHPVHSYHYCVIEIPHHESQSVKRQVINPTVVGKGQEEGTIEGDRNRRTYSPYWHLYSGHYDAEKYKKAMEKYDENRLKSCPKGRRWCKLRYNAVEGEEVQQILIY
jgi:hypothetical protein